MARRIVLAAFVDRIDQAGAEQVRPDTIDGGAGKVGVLRRRQPLRQRHARARDRIEDGLAAAKKAGGYGAVGVGDGDLWLSLGGARLNAVQVREEGSEL